MENSRASSRVKPWLRSLLFWLIAYAGLVLMLVALENKLVYHPYTAAQDWVPAPYPDIEDVELTCADGTHIHAWWCPAKDSDQAVLYCHGNAGNLSHRGWSIAKMREKLGVSVLIIDYPGYGKSGGSPSEQGCYQAADVGYAWLTEQKKIAPKNVILYGASLGGGVITDLASRKEHRALVLVKTFTSLPDAANAIYWWLPVPIRWLMSNRFDSASKIMNCHRPVFIAHGTADTIVPHAQGEKLYEIANEPKQFLSMLGSGHNDALPDEFFNSLKQFLRENPVK